MDQDPLNCKTIAIVEVSGVLFVRTPSPGLQYDFGSFFPKRLLMEEISL